jgi:hypothetical protein
VVLRPHTISFRKEWLLICSLEGVIVSADKAFLFFAPSGCREEEYQGRASQAFLPCFLACPERGVPYGLVFRMICGNKCKHAHREALKQKTWKYRLVNGTPEYTSCLPEFFVSSS